MTASMSCQKGSDDPQPEDPQIPPDPAQTVGPPSKAGYVCGLPKLAEKSGICQGENGLLYVIQDSADEGSDPRNTVTVVDAACKLMGTIKLKGVKNVDFEAVACGGGMVHVGDIGDNDEERDDASVLSFQYPADNNATVAPTRTYFKYSNGPQNAEGLAWQSDGLLIVTKKWGEPQKLYRLKGAVASPILTLPINSPIGDMSLSLDGRHFLFAQDESDVFHVCDWNAKCEAIKTGLSGDHEGVTWEKDGSFLFTSEDEPEMYRGHVPALGPVPVPAPAATPAPAQTVAPGKPEAWYKPGPGLRYQIMDEDDGDYVKQLKNNTQIVNIEAVKENYSELKAQVAALHAKGVKVICYHSLSYEPWRHDIGQFPSKAKGKKMSGWNEWWPDVRTSSPAHPFWDKRYDEFAKAGCDCVEDDNEVDPNDNETGFPLTRAEAAASNKRRADYAHNVGLCHIAKNNPSMSAEKAQNSDGVFIEEAGKYNERDSYLPWKTAGKFAAMVEYSSSACKPYAGFSVQFHSGGDYFEGMNFKVCD